MRVYIRLQGNRALYLVPSLAGGMTVRLVLALDDAFLLTSELPLLPCPMAQGRAAPAPAAV